MGTTVAFLYYMNMTNIVLKVDQQDKNHDLVTFYALIMPQTRTCFRGLIVCSHCSGSRNAQLQCCLQNKTSSTEKKKKNNLTNGQGHKA